MGKTFPTLAAVVGVMLPLLASAHGMPPAPAHGGRVLEANENWVELVLAGTRVQVYVLDEARMPIPSAKLGGRAMVLSGGKPYKVALTPGEGNELDGGMPVASGAQDPTVVSLTIDGHHAVARYSAGH